MNSSGGTHISAISRRRKHRNSGQAAVLRRTCGVPGFPLFQWKLHKKHFALAGNSSPVNFRRGSPKSELSARKLAAGLWQSRFMEVSGDAGAAFGDGSFHASKSEEEVTKWDLALSEASNGRKLLGGRRLIGDSVVSALLAELLRAQRCINKLKAAQKSSKNKIEQFVQKLEEEKIIWKCRELQKIEAMLDDLKDKLARERRSRERMELLNTKLVHELAEANLYAKQFMTNYEEEKKERELLEEVCNELVMQIGEDKAKFEEIQKYFIKIHEEVEEERKMLKMAELWREESIQMKLVDAKLALEDKYNQMIQLIAYLKIFLRSKGADLDTMELGDTQLIKQAAESVNIQRIVELSYDFSKSDEIFSIYEELRKDQVNERVIKRDSPPNITGPSSTIHIVNLEEDGLNNNSVLRQPSAPSDYSTGLEVTNSWETGSHVVEDHNFSSPHRRRHISLDNVNQDKNILESEAESSDNTDLESLKTGVNGVCSVSTGQSKWKASSASNLLRSCPSDGTTSSAAKTCQYKRPGDVWHRHRDSVAQQDSQDLTFDEYNGRLSTGSIQSGGITSTFLCEGSGECGFRQWELLGQRNSTDTMNPHLTRGMKGSIEWPRGIPKTNSKAIPLEERVRRLKALFDRGELSGNRVE